MKYLAGVTFLLVLAAGGCLLWSDNADMSKPIACTEDAKICADGSTVGRIGPNCEFAKCPALASATSTVLVLPPLGATSASSTEVTLGVGKTARAGQLSITLNRFLQDNRCPIEVECVHAGSVVVNATFARGVHTETDNMLSSDAPRTFEKYRISIISVSPLRRGAEKIPPESYTITFRVEETTSQ